VICSWQGRMEPWCHAFLDSGGVPPSLPKAMWNSSMESPIMAHSGDNGLLWVEPAMVASEMSLLGERLWSPKQSVVNSRLPKQMVSLREKPPHDRHSSLATTVSADEGTIRMSRGKMRCKSAFLRVNCRCFLHRQDTG
jgi:hypothetical protein